MVHSFLYLLSPLVVHGSMINFLLLWFMYVLYIKFLNITVNGFGPVKRCRSQTLCNLDVHACVFNVNHLMSPVHSLNIFGSHGE